MDNDLLAFFLLFTFLGVVKLTIDLRRNKLLMDNNAALQAMTQAVTDAVAALNDLAAKAKAGEDVSGPLSTLATNLESAVSSVGEPTGTGQSQAQHS